jgi:hypothetical protein
MSVESRKTWFVVMTAGAVLIGLLYMALAPIDVDTWEEDTSQAEGR